MKKNLFTFLALIFISSVTYSQENKKNDEVRLSRKNAIYGSLGIPIGYLLLNYERQIIRFDEDNIAIALSLSYGVYANLGEDGKATIICSDIVFGKSKHHFETDIGVAFNREHAAQGGGSVPDISPCVRICYRIQQKSNPFFFKTGLGYPEGVFAAVGLAF